MNNKKIFLLTFLLLIGMVSIKILNASELKLENKNIKTKVNKYEFNDNLYGDKGYDNFNSTIEANDGFISVGSTDASDLYIHSQGELEASELGVPVITKHDYKGNLIWEKKFPKYTTNGTNSGNTLNAIIKSNDGNYITVGEDGIIIKIDNDGNVLKEGVYNKDSSRDDEVNFRDIILTKTGNYVLVGREETGGYVYNDSIIIELDDEGNEIWKTTYGAYQQDSFYSVIEDSDGNFVATGYVLVNESSRPGNVTDKPLGFMDGTIVKFDKDGNILWDKLYGTDDMDNFYSIVEANDGGYVVIGNSYSRGKGGNLTDSFNGKFDGVLLKVDKNGNHIWDQVYGGNENEHFNSIKNSSDGGYIVVGETKSSENAEIIDKNSGDYDGLVVKFDDLGNAIYEKQYGGKETDYFKDIIETKKGGYVLVGYSKNSSSTDNITHLSKGNTDGLLITIKKDLGEIPTIDGVDDIAISYGSNFDPMECVSANDKEDGDLSNKVIVSGSVETNILGDYYLNYTVVDSDLNKVSKDRKVSVIDDISPIINSLDKADIKAKNSLSDEELKSLFKVSASDNYDGDLTSKVVVNQSKINYDVPGIYDVIFSIKDSSGNRNDKKVILKILSNEVPVLKGVEDIEVINGSDFNPMDGVSANDKEDGDITGAIDVYSKDLKDGLSTIYNYSVTDSDGNKEEVNRTVKYVSVPNNKPVIDGVDNTDIFVGEDFDPMDGVSAIDKEDGDLSSSIILSGIVNNKVAGDYTLTYSVVDSDNNIVSVDRIISVKDIVVSTNNKPIISGANDVKVKIGSDFDIMAGIVASDVEDGDLSNYINVVSNELDTSIVGDYKIVYSVIDSDNNISNVSRTISVYDEGNKVNNKVASNNTNNIDKYNKTTIVKKLIETGNSTIYFLFVSFLLFLAYFIQIKKINIMK